MHVWPVLFANLEPERVGGGDGKLQEGRLREHFYKSGKINMMYGIFFILDKAIFAKSNIIIAYNRKDDTCRF